MMQGFHKQQMMLSLNRLNKAAGVRGITFLPKLGRRWACYRWLLWICGRDGKCPFGHKHITAKEVMDEFAGKLVNQLNDGVAKLVEQHGAQEASSLDNKKEKEQREQ